MPVGTQYLFVSAGGSVYTNRFVNYKYATMPGSDAEYTNHDICIGLLEDELPVDIRPAKFLPDDFADYLGSGHALPFITIEQNERAHVVDIAELTTAANRYNLIGPLISKSYLREPFGKHFISGDSSSPRLLVLGNEVVLFGTVWKAGGAGCNATLFKQEIQYTMNFLCPGYDIQEVDLSAFSRLEYRGGAEK